MYRPRIIPVLLLSNEGLVKTRGFDKRNYIGDPINAVHIFNNLKADEIVFLDIDAGKNKTPISLDFVKNIGEEAFMPFAVGGGISTLKDIEERIQGGAEKVVICSAAFEKKDFVKSASAAFGSSTISVCIDVKKDFLRRDRVWIHGGKTKTDLDPVSFAMQMEDAGAGEIILQSISQDGAMLGYDTGLLSQVSHATSIPLVALGGAGSMEDLHEGHSKGHASGLAAGSLFVYQGKHRGVLINYPSDKEKITFHSRLH